MDWSKICDGLSRTARRYAGVLRKRNGDRAEAARLLWCRARHNKALREDLIKAACALLALAPVEVESRAKPPTTEPCATMSRRIAAARRLWRGVRAMDKPFAALARAVKIYKAFLFALGPNTGEAATLLWNRSRDDKSLREDLVKAACVLISSHYLRIEQISAELAAQWQLRSGRPTMFDRDPEMAGFVRKRLETMSPSRIAEAARQRFGPDRAPSAGTIRRYRQRPDYDRRTAEPEA